MPAALNRVLGRKVCSTVVGVYKTRSICQCTVAGPLDSAVSSDVWHAAVRLLTVYCSSFEPHSVPCLQLLLIAEMAVNGWC